MIGKVIPGTLKPLPVTMTALTDNGALPTEARSSDCVAGVFKGTFPKATLDELTPSEITCTPNCKANVSATPPALAVRVAVCAVLTEEAAAMKLTVVDPDCTVTEFGTVTAESLLDRLTAKPQVAAAEFRVTVQLSVPAPEIDPLTQVMPVNIGISGVVPVWPDAFNCKANVSAAPPALAVRVAVCAVLTGETAAVKLAVVDPGCTVTEAGTVTAESLLDRLTVKPPLAAVEFNATVQLSIADPVAPLKAQLSDVNSTLVVAFSSVPVPLSPTTKVPSAVALLAIVNWPASAPIPVGTKFTLMLYVPPAGTVIGRLPAPLTEKACPDTLICETFTAADPWFITVTVVLAIVPVATAPKLTEFGDTWRDPAMAFTPTICPPKQPHNTVVTQIENKMKG